MDSVSLFQAFFEESSDGLMAVRLSDSSIYRVNNTLTSLYNMNREELEGERLTVFNFSTPTGYERERLFSLEVIENEGYYNDILIVTKTGEARFASVKVKHLFIENEKFALVVLADDTERQFLMRDLIAKHQSMEQAYQELEKVHTQLKSTQEKMAQASKLVALGELAAGMSHELNQPLTGVRGFAQELQDIIQHTHKPKRKQLIELCQDIIDNSDKMASLLSHLRDFARKEKTNFEASSHKTESVSLKNATENVLKLLKKQFSNKNIDIDVQNIPHDLQVMAQMHPLEQVLINLFTNSRDSILEKSETNTKLKGKIEVIAQKQNKDVVIKIKDNGVGIPENIKARIFDPFFSTKEQGKGLGLGLSISYGIIHSFGGEISIEESDSEGTCFKIKLALPNSQTNKNEEAKAA